MPELLQAPPPGLSPASPPPSKPRRHPLFQWTADQARAYGQRGRETMARRRLEHSQAVATAIAFAHSAPSIRQASRIDNQIEKILTLVDEENSRSKPDEERIAGLGIAAKRLLEVKALLLGEGETRRRPGQAASRLLPAPRPSPATPPPAVTEVPKVPDQVEHLEPIPLEPPD